MIGVETATRQLLEVVLACGNLAPTDVRKAAEALRSEITNIDKPHHICPLCAQPKYQLEILDLLVNIKNMEVWSDDGQTWTIDVTQCEGNADEIVQLMLDVKSGAYTKEVTS